MNRSPGRAAQVFEELIVGVAAGVHKRSFFSLDERLRLTESVFADVGNIPRPRL